MHPSDSGGTDTTPDLSAADDGGEYVPSVGVATILARLILNVFAGGMMAKGFGDKEFWEHIVAFAIIVTTLSWSVIEQRYHRKKRKRRKKKANHEPTQTPPSI